MNARRFGVSTIWAMFSRVTSKTIGVVVGVEERLDLVEERELLGREVEVHRAPSKNLTTRQFTDGSAESDGRVQYDGSA